MQGRAVRRGRLQDKNGLALVEVGIKFDCSPRFGSRDGFGDEDLVIYQFSRGMLGEPVIVFGDQAADLINKFITHSAASVFVWGRRSSSSFRNCPV